MIETIRTWTKPACADWKHGGDVVNTNIYGTMNINYLLDWATSNHVNVEETKENRNYFYIQSSASVGGKYLIASEYCGKLDNVIRLSTYDLETYKRVSITYITGTESNNPMVYHDGVLYLQTKDRNMRGFAVDEETGVVGGLVTSESLSLYYSGITVLDGVWYGVRNGEFDRVYKDIRGDVKTLYGLSFKGIDTSQIYNPHYPDDTKHHFQSMTTDGAGNLAIACSYPNGLHIASVSDHGVKSLGEIEIGETVAGRPLGEIESISYDKVNDRFLICGQFLYDEEYTGDGGFLYYNTVFEMGEKVVVNKSLEYYGTGTRKHTNKVGTPKNLYVNVLEDTSIVRHTGELELPFATLTEACYFGNYIYNATPVSDITIVVKYDTTAKYTTSYCYGGVTIRMDDGAKVGKLHVFPNLSVALVNGSNTSQNSEIAHVEVEDNCNVRISTECSKISIGRSTFATIDRAGACELAVESAIISLYKTVSASGTSTAYSGYIRYSLTCKQSADVTTGVTVSNPLIL